MGIHVYTICTSCGHVDGLDEVRLRVARRADRAVLAASPIAVDVSVAGLRIDVTPGLAAGTRGVSTDVVLEVPPDAVVDAIEIDDGRLEVDGVRGAVRARVVRGDIRAADVSGIVRLETSMGDVSVSRARLSAGGLLRLRAFNGDVASRSRRRPRTPASSRWRSTAPSRRRFR